MKAATWRGGARFTIDEVPEPVAGPGQVVVEVQAAGICGTDVHATQGLFPYKPRLVLGHEYTGMVRGVGCEPSFGCGKCAECEAGRVSQCPNLTRLGGFAQRVAMPAHCAHPLPRGLDSVAGALTEPAACCLAGLETFPMPRNATVLVIGGGIMGLLTMALAKRRGAKRLILSDPLEERRAIAKSLGAGVVVDPTREKLRERVMALTGDRGADVVAEAVGKPELVAEAMTLVKPTGVLQLVGVSPKGSAIPLSLWDVHYREIKVVGAFGRGTAFRRALALMPTLRVGRLITARFPLERIGEAFAHATAGRGAKTVITPNVR